MKTNKQIIEEAIKGNTIEWEGIEIERNREVTIEKALQIQKEDILKYLEERIYVYENIKENYAIIKKKREIAFEVLGELLNLKQKLEEK